MTGRPDPRAERAAAGAAAAPAPIAGARRMLLLAAAVLLALAGLSGVVQLVGHLFGVGAQPGVLLALHLVAAPLALMSAAGIVRRRAWTARAVLLWTVAMMAIFAAIGPTLGLDPAATRALWAPAALVVAFATLVLWGLRAPAR